MTIQKETIRTDIEGHVFGVNSGDGLEYMSTGITAELLSEIGMNVEEFCGQISEAGAKVILDEEADKHVLWIHETEVSRKEFKDKVSLYLQSKGGQSSV